MWLKPLAMCGADPEAFNMEEAMGLTIRATFIIDFFCVSP